MIRFWFVVLLALFGLSVSPQPVAVAAQTWSPARETRYQALLGELRCMVCQNESLKASHADLAKDLRHQIHGMIARGESNKQIEQYLVNRYGEYILYRPRFELRTWVLWLGPFVLLGVGLLIIMMIIRRSSRKPASRTLDPDELARARRYLEDRSE